jgi:hypothetical protein
VSPQTSANVSVPTNTKAPRDLSQEERTTLARAADTLIPASGDHTPAASAEPGFWDGIALALDARADAFDDIVDALHALAQTAPSELWSRLQSLDHERPMTFQALSAVVTGAWLLTPGTRDRIGYHGQQSDKAGLEEAADEIASGILDPVLERDAADGPRWIR